MATSYEQCYSEVSSSLSDDSTMGINEMLLLNKCLSDSFDNVSSCGLDFISCGSDFAYVLFGLDLLFFSYISLFFFIYFEQTYSKMKP